MNESELQQTLNELKSDIAKYNFVYARSDGYCVEESLKRAGRSKGWFYGLPKSEQERLESIACELNANTTAKAKMILESAKIEAVEVKVSGLKNRDPHISQAVATEIIDRTLGKVVQTTDVRGVLEVNVNDAREAIQRKLVSISNTSGDG